MYYEVYKKLKKQESWDSGYTWSDVYPAEYMKGDFICNNTTCSSDVYNTVQYQWSGNSEVISSDGGVTWRLTGKERIAASGLPQSILDAIAREEALEAEMQQMEESGEEEPQQSGSGTQNVGSDNSDHNLYYLERKEQRVLTKWVPAFPMEFRLSSTVAEADSETCGHSTVSVQYRWVDSGEVICEEVEGTVQYKWVADPSRSICVGSAKYHLEVKYTSSDGGLTWTKVEPEETRAGDLMTSYSDDCNLTVTVTYNVNLATDPDVIQVVSDGSVIEYAMLEGEYPIILYGNFILKDDLPSGIASFDITYYLNTGEIPMRFLYNITRVRAADLAAGITSIGQNAFMGTRVASLTVRADDCFLGGFLPSTIAEIKVPSSRVSHYQQAYNWSNYASIIESI